jgi:hypothetical protein
MGTAPRPIPVAHPMQLLYWSFRGAATSGFGLLRSSKPPVPVDLNPGSLSSIAKQP